MRNAQSPGHSLMAFLQAVLVLFHEFVQLQLDLVVSRRQSVPLIGSIINALINDYHMAPIALEDSPCEDSCQFTGATIQ